MSNVKLLLLPLPEPWQCETRMCPRLYSDEQITAYARANVEHHTEALRAEVERLKELVRSVGYETLTRAEKAEARAERLAEALRMIEGFTMSQFPDAADMAGACVETAHNALHHTAEQENNNA